MTKTTKKGRARFIRAAFVFFIVFGSILGAAALFHPDSKLPKGWNPTTQLQVTDDVTPLTHWKLRNAISDPEQCLAVLDSHAAIEILPPLMATDNCYIENRVRLRQLGDAALAPVETSCAVALRMAMWEHHGLQPAAADQGLNLSRILHLGSYSCRRMRTSSGPGRMSTHATASAIDVEGFELDAAGQFRYITDWDTQTEASDFLKAARNTACDWFGLTLSPDYNDLHADHLHLQTRGWGGCR